MFSHTDYDDEEDAWEMPNFYNETYMKEGNRHSIFPFTKFSYDFLRFFANLPFN